MLLAPGRAALCLSALLSLTAARVVAQGDEAGPASADSAAQAERAAMARALFTEGLAHARESRFTEAIDRFSRAHELRPAPGIAYNLASALARVGRLVEASELLHWVIRHAETPEEMRRAAQATVDRLAPRLASVQLAISGPSEGVELRLDGAPLAFAAVGVDVPLDPGPHRFEALRGGARVALREVELVEGAREWIELTVSPPPATAPPPIEPVVLLPEPVREPEPPAEDLTWLAWAGGALAVALAVAGITAAILTAEQGAVAPPIPGTTTPPFLEWD